jgi:tRNA(fMet)-specific endonuclease VapC
MKYLLDTNTCIRHLNRRSQAIIDKLASLPSDEIAVCAVVKAELFYGAHKSQYPMLTLEKQQQFLDQFVSLPFDDESALIFGQIRAKLELAGTPIGLHDLQIAAIALAHNLIVVTHNVREFGRIERLHLIDWEV